MRRAVLEWIDCRMAAWRVLVDGRGILLPRASSGAATKARASDSCDDPKELPHARLGHSDRLG
jgi:hypothetical protein